MNGRLAAVALVVLACAGPLQAAEHKTTTESYESFPALTATLFHDDGTRGVMTVQGGIDVKDPAFRARVSASAPRLRDAYVSSLTVYAAGLTPGAPPDIDEIGRRLQRATDQVMKRPGAQVLLGTVIVN